jgi:hypothetical protein
MHLTSAIRERNYTKVKVIRILKDSGMRYLIFASSNYSTVQYSTVQYSTVQYSTVQYSTHAQALD